MEEDYLEESTETETDSLPDVVMRKGAKVHQGQWQLQQNLAPRAANHLEDGVTEGSDLENYVEEEEEERPVRPSRNKKAIEDPSYMMNHRVPKSSSSGKLSSKKKKTPLIASGGEAGLQRPSKGQKKSKACAKNDDDQGRVTDDELLDVNSADFRKIVREELFSVRGTSLALKPYGADVSHRRPKRDSLVQAIVAKDSPGEESEETDCSDVGVSNLDYYKIRAETDDNVRSKQKNQQLLPADDDELTSEESDLDESDSNAEGGSGASTCSELEVNMKDYYAIRKESTGREAAVQLQLKVSETGTSCHESGLSNPAERALPTQAELQRMSSQDELMTYGEFLKIHKKVKKANATPFNRPPVNARQLKARAKFQPDTAKQIVMNRDTKADGDPDEESLGSSDDSSRSNNTEDDLDLSDLDQGHHAGKPAIRLVEVEGCEGAISVLCAPGSPTRDSVHGIKFIDLSDRSHRTEEYSNVSDPEVVDEMRNDPATDDEELSDLEMDKSPFHKTSTYSLPETKSKVYSIKTRKDGKTISTEKFVNQNEAVSWEQFIKEKFEGLSSDSEELEASDDEAAAEKPLQHARMGQGQVARTTTSVKKTGQTGSGGHQKAGPTTKSSSGSRGIQAEEARARPSASSKPVKTAVAAQSNELAPGGKPAKKTKSRKRTPRKKSGSEDPPGKSGSSVGRESKFH